MVWLYSYLNLESTKTYPKKTLGRIPLYSYLNLESTKTYSFVHEAALSRFKDDSTVGRMRTAAHGGKIGRASCRERV